MKYIFFSLFCLFISCAPNIYAKTDKYIEVVYNTRDYHVVDDLLGTIKDGKAKDFYYLYYGILYIDKNKGIQSSINFKKEEILDLCNSSKLKYRQVGHDLLKVYDSLLIKYIRHIE